MRRGSRGRLVNYCALSLRIVQIGAAPQNPQAVELLGLGLPADADLVVENLQAALPDFHQCLVGLLHDPELLGVAVAEPYQPVAGAYCTELSPEAEACGAVDTLVRHQDGSISGYCLAVEAVGTALRELGIKGVRTALVLGAGGAARVVLAALRELGCNRYLIGYRHPRRPAELASQFRHQRKQFAFFPLDEMLDFFTWADRHSVFNGRAMPPPAELPGGRTRSRGAGGRDDEEGLKRWDLLVNATPVGSLRSPAADEEPLVSNESFLRCFRLILDMVPQEQPTTLVSLAVQAGVPAHTGRHVQELRLAAAQTLWLAELQNRLSGVGRSSERSKASRSHRVLELKRHG